MKFKLKSPFGPTGDQPQAIDKLVAGLEKKLPHQVLLGVTGSGKTFTIANVIEQIQRPTLIISHNKTLAAQLYQEFKSFFPDNAVCYFVSYYDYYQPEAYIPQTDSYIEKEADINEELDRLRLSATTNLLTRQDVIVVSSVSCIYNLGSPVEYGRNILELGAGSPVSRETVIERLTQLQYERSDFGFHRGTFRVRGDTIDIFPAYEEIAVRVILGSKKIESLQKIHPLTGKTIQLTNNSINKSTHLPPPGSFNSTIIYPAKHYIADTKSQNEIFQQIRHDLDIRVKELKKQGKKLEAQRLATKVNYDLEMIEQVGYVNGIENYSRYFDGRLPGQPPYTLLDYFDAAADKLGKNWLLVIDESHMTIPQIKGMYNGDHSRKQVLIDFGFRLPAAYDNRPLRFDEFTRRIPQTIYTSATPAPWEIQLSGSHITQQLVRPTGLVDPKILIRPTEGQIDDLIKEIKSRVKKHQRALVTTLTKRMAEDLANFLEGKGIKVHYLHSEIETLDRVDILEDLRRGNYDVVVGINLLREGLDLPEVSLVVILDADKEGFLRSETSLIQTMGRAARHENSLVILYADNVTGSIKRAVEEVKRRRKAQLAYNKRHAITPKTIQKPIREKLVELQPVLSEYGALDVGELTPYDKKKVIKRLQKEMREASALLEFEVAGQIRDQIKTLISQHT